MRDFICGHGANVDSECFAAMRMNGDGVLCGMYGSGTICNTAAVGACKKRWWHNSGRAVSVCRCVSPNFDSPFVRCFEEFDYEKVHGQFVFATRLLVMSGLPPATELIKFHGHSNRFACFRTRITASASATLHIVNAFRVVKSSSVGIMPRHTSCQELYMPSVIRGVWSGVLNTRGFAD